MRGALLRKRLILPALVAVFMDQRDDDASGATGTTTTPPASPPKKGPALSGVTKALLIIALLLALAITLPGLVIRSLRPPRTDREVELFQSILYVRRARSTPRPLMIHVVEIDLEAHGGGFLVTPGDSTKGLEAAARTTSAFLEEFDVQIAINGGFSRPFRAGRFLWDYYPHSGDPVDVTGLAISNGETYSDDHGDWPVICIAAGDVEIRPAGCPKGTTQALAGNHLLVQDGKRVVQNSTDALHPRTAVAVDAEGETLWLIVVDGRQRNYSEGVTLEELADMAVELGADRALNLDGGGSSTLVVARGDGAKVLNAPIHTRVPMRERPVATHLGVYAQTN